MTQDKPRVERCVQYVRSNFFAGEQFRDIDDCRERAEQWCSQTAGMRIHGTTRMRPAEVFAADELPQLKAVPEAVFDIPTWTHPKVAPDRHVFSEPNNCSNIVPAVHDSAGKAGTPSSAVVRGSVV